MNSIQKAVLVKMLSAYDYVALHPGCSVYEMSAALGFQETTMRDVLHRLRSGGWAVSKPGARSQAGQLPAEWRLTFKERPTEPPPSKKLGRKCKPCKIDQPSKMEDAKRIITRAKQIGMLPDPFALPASFFHPAAVSA